MENNRKKYLSLFLLKWIFIFCFGFRLVPVLGREITLHKSEPEIVQEKRYEEYLAEVLKIDGASQMLRKEEKRSRDEKEYLRLRSLEEHRCQVPRPGVGCPNYEPKYDKNGRPIY